MKYICRIKAGRRGELATYTQTEDITEGNLTRDKDDSLCLLAVCTVSSCIYTASQWGWVRKLKNQSTVWYESTHYMVWVCESVYTVLYAMKLLRLIWVSVQHGMSQNIVCMCQYTVLYESTHGMSQSTLWYSMSQYTLCYSMSQSTCMVCGGRGMLFGGSVYTVLYESAYSIVLWFSLRRN